MIDAAKIDAAQQSNYFYLSEKIYFLSAKLAAVILSK